MNFYNSRYKLTVSLCLLVVISFLLGGCSESKSSSAAPSLKDIENKIASVTDMNSLQAADNETLKNLYNITSAETESSILYIANSNIKADEIALFKAKSPDTLKVLQDKAAQRLKDKEASFKDYLPEEYYKVQKSVLKTHGNYLLLAISPDSEKIEAEFDASFSK